MQPELLAQSCSRNIQVLEIPEILRWQMGTVPFGKSSEYRKK